MYPSATVSVYRAAINRQNSQHSTGPRTEAGKQRSSQNALTHGLTARTALLSTEDPAEFERHVAGFFDEYKPANGTEIQLVQELADTSWRLNRIPLLETQLLDRAMTPPSEQSAIDFDIVDAHRAIATLGLHGARLSRQFQKALEQLREIQRTRLQRERRDLLDAVSLLEIHKRDGLAFNPADHGFVLPLDQIEKSSSRINQLARAHIFDRNRFRHLQYGDSVAAGTFAAAF